MEMLCSLRAHSAVICTRGDCNVGPRMFRVGPKGCQSGPVAHQDHARCAAAPRSAPAAEIHGRHVDDRALSSVSQGLFMRPGLRSQSADRELCRSLCSGVCEREAQCFSLDLALVRLALLQSPLRARLLLLWPRGGGAGWSCSL